MEYTIDGGINSASTSLSTALSASSDDSTPSAPPPTSLWRGSSCHVWNTPRARSKESAHAQVTTPGMTPRCTIHGFGSQTTHSSMRITSANNDFEGLAEVVNSLVSLEQMEVRTMKNPSLPSRHTIKLQRDGGSLTR